MGRVYDYTLAIGIVLFKSDLDIFRKCIISINNQSTTEAKTKIKLCLLDNDNGVQLDAISEIAENTGIDFHLVLKADNLGFGSGHNYIFQELLKIDSSFDYYLCVNPDGIPHHQMIQNLLFFANLSQNRGIFEAIQFPIQHPKVYDPITFKTNWCSGCCVLIPKEIYDKLKGFDENFFMYCEDIDLSWRVKIYGYGCFTVPNAIFHHYTFSESRNRSLEFLYTKLSLYKLAVKYDIKILKIIQILRLLKCINQPIKLINMIYTSNQIEILPITKQQRDEFINFRYGTMFSDVKFR